MLLAITGEKEEISLVNAKIGCYIKNLTIDKAVHAHNMWWLILSWVTTKEETLNALKYYYCKLLYCNCDLILIDN